MHRWKLSALAAAAVVSVGLTASDAWALALGRVSVQSALGEPLRAEVDIPQMSAAEAESLRAAVASPNVFRNQGMEYSPIANNVRVEVVRRPNGTAVLRLSTAQAVNDPFVDLVIDANWASGSLQRNYTMLLDPPKMQRPAPTVTANAQASLPDLPASARVRPVPQVSSASTAPGTAAAPAARRPAANEVAAAPAKAPAAASSAGSSGGEIRVKTGDTAGRLAGANRPAGVSLDQMLVAMLRANPQAFINGNIHRLRTGAVIAMPDEATAASTSAREARQIVAAQSKDFNQFRRQLASNAPKAPVTAANREASGSVQSQVDESKPSSDAPNKLKLSKGGVKAAAADEKLAQKKQAEEQAAREAELQRNMAELKDNIASAPKPASDAAAAGKSAAPAVAAAVPAVEVAATNPAAATPAPATPAAEPAVVAAAAPVAADPAAATSAPAAEPAPDAAAQPEAAAAPAVEEPPKPAPVVVAPPPPAAEPSFIDSLMEDPTIPLAGAALLALLLGYGGYRVAQRRRAASTASDASALGDSQLAPDSFFGGSGGQHVDTNSNHAASSQLSAHSMHYSPSQLDAGDGDPLIEAEVYLAYGQDSQAEDILKEAIRTSPQRLALYQKMAEIYAKRKDRKAYEINATNLRDLSQSQGIEWIQVADAGRELDPVNPLYQTTADGSPLDSAPTQFDPNSGINSRHTPSVTTDLAIGAAAGVAAAGVANALHDHQPLDISSPDSSSSRMDLDFDLSLPGDMITSAPEISPVAPKVQAPAPAPVAAMPMLDIPEDPLAAALAATNRPHMDPMSFSATLPSTLENAGNPASILATEPVTLDTMELNLEDFGSAPVLASAPAVSATDSHTMEFDMSALSLDLPSTASGSVAAPSMPEDPLATKLALAKEFSAIGDNDGARALVEEVIAASQGDLKVKAQQLLAELA